MSILRFEGTQFKKAPGAVSKRGPISKKFGFPMFLTEGKNLTPMQVEIKKWPQKGLPYCLNNQKKGGRRSQLSKGVPTSTKKMGNGPKLHCAQSSKNMDNFADPKRFLEYGQFSVLRNYNLNYFACWLVSSKRYLCPLQKFLQTDFTVASSSAENCKICTAVNLKCKLVARHKKTKHRTGSNQKSARFHDAMAGHRIGITNNRSSRLDKDTTVAKKNLNKLTHSLPRKHR